MAGVRERPLTPAEARVWVQHLLRVEAGALSYAYPRTPEAEAESYRLYDVAEKIGRPRGRCYESAMRKWRG